MSAPEGRPAEEAIRRALQPGEELLWRGGPDPAKHIGAHDAAVSGLGLALCAGVVATVLFEGLDPNGMPLALLLLLGALLLLGLFLLVGRLPVKAWYKVRTRYGLSDQRALIARRSGRVRSVWLVGADVTVEADRRGRLTVGFPDEFEWNLPGNIKLEHSGVDDLLGMPRHTVFWEVSDAEALRKALATASERSGCHVSDPAANEPSVISKEQRS